MNFVNTAPIASADLKGLSRVPSLDGVRGTALLMVLGAHAYPRLWGGFIGVDLFFVLSGFLITTILLKEYAASGSIKIVPFYIRRALRLLPALIAMLLVVIVYTWLFEPAELPLTLINARGVALYYWNWVLVENYGIEGWRAGPQMMLAHLWSLSVEEQFYILWPFVLGGALWFRRPWVLGAVLAAGIIGPAVGRLMVYDGSPTLNQYFRTDLHFDGLMWGALGAWIVFGRWLPTTQRFLSCLSLMGAVAFSGFVAASYFALLESGFVFLGGWTALAAIAMVALVSLVWCPNPMLRPVMSFAPLRWTGKISYGLYLWHFPVFRLFAYIPIHHTYREMAAVAVTYAIAAISFYGMERHFLNMKDILAPHRAARAAFNAAGGT